MSNTNHLPSENDEQFEAYNRTEKIKEAVYYWFLDSIDDDDRARFLEFLKILMCLHCGSKDHPCYCLADD